MTVVGLTVAAIILTRWGAQVWLERLNTRHTLSHAKQVPVALEGVIDRPTYDRSVNYTVAKSRFYKAENGLASIVLLVVLLSGLLPWSFTLFSSHFGFSAWAMAAFVFVTGLTISLPGLPLDWYSQFHLEERFGFNTSTPRVWWLDRAKGLLLSIVLGYPLLVLVLKLVEWTGPAWWLWAWVALMVFQVLMLVLAYPLSDGGKGLKADFQFLPFLSCSCMYIVVYTYYAKFKIRRCRPPPELPSPTPIAVASHQGLSG